MPSHIVMLTATYIAAQMGSEAARHDLSGEDQSTLFQKIAEIAVLSSQYEVRHQPIPHHLYRDLIDVLVEDIRKGGTMPAEHAMMWLQCSLRERKRA